MATYLLTWNPKLWSWDDLSVAVAETAMGGSFTMRWSTGNTKRVEKGDDLFLLRQGEEPRGVMASGVAVSDVLQAPHWDEDHRKRGDLFNGVEAKFHRVLDPEQDELLDLRGLEELSSIPVRPAASGFKIREPGAQALELAWTRHLAGLDDREPIPHEVVGGGYREGAVKTITVNAYERSPAARRLCLKHWGKACAVCELLMSDRYGALAEDLIHVHHLEPLELAGGERVVDPVRDLRPVCPNCHAVMHLTSPPLTIKQVRERLHKSGDMGPR